MSSKERANNIARPKLSAATKKRLGVGQTEEEINGGAKFIPLDISDVLAMCGNYEDDYSDLPPTKRVRMDDETEHQLDAREKRRQATLAARGGMPAPVRQATPFHSPVQQPEYSFINGKSSCNPRRKHTMQIDTVEDTATKPRSIVGNPRSIASISMLDISGSDDSTNEYTYKPNVEVSKAFRQRAAPTVEADDMMDGNDIFSSVVSSIEDVMQDDLDRSCTTTSTQSTESQGIATPATTSTTGSATRAEDLDAYMHDNDEYLDVDNTTSTVERSDQAVNTTLLSRAIAMIQKLPEQYAIDTSKLIQELQIFQAANEKQYDSLVEKIFTLERKVELYREKMLKDFRLLCSIHNATIPVEEAEEIPLRSFTGTLRRHGLVDGQAVQATQVDQRRAFEHSTTRFNNAPERQD